MIRHQVPSEQTSINLSNISEQVYWKDVSVLADNASRKKAHFMKVME